MADLADITGAEDGHTLTDYVLSPLSLKDFGIIERSVEADRIAEVEATVGGLPASVAQVVAPMLLRAIHEDIAKGKYSFGRQPFNAYVLSGKAGGLLLWLSIRHKHPEFTRAEAEKLADTPDAEKTRDEVLALSGYRQQDITSDDEARPLDWHKLYRAIEKAGVPFVEIGNLTLAQVQDKLGIEAPKPSPSRKPEEQKKAERALAFDALCKKHNLTPTGLKDLPPSQLAEMLKAEGNRMIDQAKLTSWVREYAAGSKT